MEDWGIGGGVPEFVGVDEGVESLGRRVGGPSPGNRRRRTGELTRLSGLSRLRRKFWMFCGGGDWGREMRERGGSARV